MDPQLPAQLAQFLAPYLPYLVKGVKLAGQEAAKKLGEKASEQGFDHAKALWDKLRCKKNVEQVAQTFAALPDNQTLCEALREEIAVLRSTSSNACARPLISAFNVFVCSSTKRPQSFGSREIRSQDAL